MVTLRFAIPAILAAAAVAGYFSYFVAPPAPVEADERLSDVRLPPAVLHSTGPSTRVATPIDQPPNADELSAAPSTSVSVLNFSGLCGRMSRSHSLNRPRRRRPSASTAVRSRCRNWPSADLRTVWTMRTVEPLGFPAKPVCWSW
jgi:hypothetical protein